MSASNINIQQSPSRVLYSPVFRITNQFEIRYRQSYSSSNNVLDGKGCLRIDGVPKLDKVYQSHASIEACSAATTPLKRARLHTDDATRDTKILLDGDNEVAKVPVCAIAVCICKQFADCSAEIRCAV